MPLQLSKNQITEIMRKADGAIKKAERVKDKSEQVINNVVRTMVVSGTSFAFGVANGRFGAVTPLGVPIDLGVGVAAHLAGFTGIVGNATAHAHAIGDGALAAYTYTVGRGTGKAWRKKSGLPEMAGMDGVAGKIEATGGGGLSDEQLAALARRA